MKRRNEVLVGAVVLLSIVLVILGTLWMKGAALGREEMEIRARFREVGQLQHGNAVKVRGVPIGRVDHIELESSGDGVIVTMRVKSDVVLPQDPVVVLAPSSMFGDWQAEIFPRSAAREYDFAEATDATILPGATLADISRLTAVAERIANNMATLSSRFEVAFTDETATNIRRVIDNVQIASERLSQIVAGQQQGFQGLGEDLRETATLLSEAVSRVNRTFGEIEQAMSGDKLAHIIDNAERASTQIDSLSHELLQASRSFSSTAATVDTAMRAVGEVANALANREGTLGLMLRDTTLYWRIVESNAELQALLRDLRENPRRYINLRVF